MADLTIAQASVVPQPNAVIVRDGFIGASITAGSPMWWDDVAMTFKNADAATSAAVAAVAGICLSTTFAGQPASRIIAGDLAVGAVLTVGQTYVLSSNAGKIAPISDVATGMWVTILGVAISTSVLRLGLLPSGIQRA